MIHGYCRLLMAIFNSIYSDKSTTSIDRIDDLDIKRERSSSNGTSRKPRQQHGHNHTIFLVEYGPKPGSRTVYIFGDSGILLFKDFMTSSEDEPQTPTGSSLLHNYPNPFNGSTIIEFRIPVEMHVQLKVVNILGIEVSSLIDEVKSPDRYTISWPDPVTNSSTLSTGI